MDAKMIGISRTPFRFERYELAVGVGEVENDQDYLEMLAHQFLNPDTALVWEFKLMVEAMCLAFKAGRKL